MMHRFIAGADGKLIDLQAQEKVLDEFDAGLQPRHDTVEHRIIAPDTEREMPAVLVEDGEVYVIDAVTVVYPDTHLTLTINNIDPTWAPSALIVSVIARIKHKGDRRHFVALANGADDKEQLISICAEALKRIS